jgi:glutamate racemase
VLATEGTIKSHSYPLEIRKLFPEIEVTGEACPMWVPLVETGEFNSEGADFFVKRHIDNLMARDPEIDSIILGCTHYPIIKDLIADVAKDVLGKEINIIDSGLEAAKATKDVLSGLDLLKDDEKEGCVRYFVSDETQNFKNTASIFLGEPAENVTKVSVG